MSDTILPRCRNGDFGRIGTSGLLKAGAQHRFLIVSASKSVPVGTLATPVSEKVPSPHLLLSVSTERYMEMLTDNLWLLE